LLLYVCISSRKQLTSTLLPLGVGTLLLLLLWWAAFAMWQHAQSLNSNAHQAQLHAAAATAAAAVVGLFVTWQHARVTQAKCKPPGSPPRCCPWV
jgi:hypothetical protein